MKFNVVGFSVLVGLLSVFTGCMTYPGPGFVAPADTMEDEVNKPFVAQAQADYEARLKFRRKVVIVPSEKANIFLSQNLFRDASVPKKRELLTACESVLRETVAGLRDFEVISSEAGGIPAAVTGDAVAASGIYRISFEIADLQVREGMSPKDNILLDAVLDVAGRNPPRQREFRYYVMVKVDVTLTSPDGKQVFKYSSIGCSNSIALNRPSNNSWLLNQNTLANDAVSDAVHTVLSSYSRDFGPPMYVKALIGGGAFAQISAGTEYGILPGQRVEFYRNRQRALPSLPNEPPKFEFVRDVVGYGVVGDRGCPIEANSAWVFVDGNDEPAKEGRPDAQAVRLWTSARIVD